VLGTAQGNDPKKLASWRRAARLALYQRRLMFAQVPSLAEAQRPQPLDSWKIRLIDGDTFAYGTERIRIQGIDAPELSEPGGFEASQRLDLLLREGPVRIVPQALDRYGRTVAEVYVDDRNVAEVLRSEGYAKAGSR
jgi:endonuclease YncB( thermonuclease family)